MKFLICTPEVTDVVITVDIAMGMTMETAGAQAISQSWDGFKIAMPPMGMVKVKVKDTAVTEVDMLTRMVAVKATATTTLGIHNERREKKN
jgi:hypothetical protein